MNLLQGFYLNLAEGIYQVSKARKTTRNGKKKGKKTTMIYVMSDIHGRKDRFDDIMKQINLKDEDTLYILGDIIDRNPYGIALLKYAMETPNIKMLLGNHELMMYETMRYKGNKFLWYSNGGEITHERWKKYRIATREKMLDYIYGLPLMLDIEVNNKKYRIVHGRSPKPKQEYYMSKEKIRNIAVWDRVMPGDTGPEEMTVIFGHTPTIFYQPDEPPRIWYGQNLIGIDCGAAYIDGRLACLRLDDMKEFYSRC